MELMPGIRNGVRAVIFRDNHVLLLRKRYEDHSERYVLPGGSQDTGETLEEALRRECLEEIGTEIRLSGLLYLGDFFKPRGTEPQTYRQQVEYFFSCEVPDTYEARNGRRPDKHQVDVVWSPVSRLDAINIFPSGVAELLMKNSIRPHSIYVGEISP